MQWLKNLLGGINSRVTPANAGELEVAMSDSTTATPPAASGGTPSLTKADLEALLKPLAETVATLAAGQKALVDGHKALADGQKAQAEALGKVGSPEAVAKLVTEQISTHQKAQAEATAKSATKAELRKAVIAAKLPGVPDSLLASLPDTEDKAALEAAADTLRKSLDGLGVKLADTKSATADGGTSAATEQAKTAAGTGFLKMPAGVTVPPPAATTPPAAAGAAAVKP